VLQEIANTAIALVGVLVFGNAVTGIGNYPIGFICIQQTAKVHIDCVSDESADV